MKTRVIIYIGLGMSILVAWHFLVMSSLGRKHISVSQQIVEAETELTDIRRTMSQLPALLANQQSLKESKERMPSSLHAKRDILAFLKRAEEMALNRNLTIREITPPVEELLELNIVATSSPEPQFLNITMLLDGRYLDFGQFVLDLEKAPFFRGVNVCRIHSPRTPVDRTSFTIGFLGLLGDGGTEG